MRAEASIHKTLDAFHREGKAKESGLFFVGRLGHVDRPAVGLVFGRQRRELVYTNLLLFSMFSERTVYGATLLV